MTIGFSRTRSKTTMVSRRQILQSGQALAWLGLPVLGGTQALGCTTTRSDDRQDLDLLPLKDQAAHIKKLFGTAADQDVLDPPSDYSAALLNECAMVTPENSMKWERLRPTPTTYDFSKADWLVDYADANGLEVHGHTLVWHLQLPKWFDEHVHRDNAERELIAHVETVAGRYAGRLRSWDVVNEAINPEDGRHDGLRLTPWLRFLGTDYIDQAFRIAEATDPSAQLVYNDFGLEYDDDVCEARRRHVLDLLTGLVAGGTPIHALGIQAHLDADYPRSFTRLDRFLSDVADLGIDVMITELDVADQTLPQDIEMRDCLVADTYRAFLETVAAHDHVVSIAVWGLSDRYSWLNEFTPRADGHPNRPLPLDDQLNRKAAWYAISDTLASIAPEETDSR